MEKTIQLDQRELQAVAGIEQEVMQANAQWGMLRRQLDQADKICEQVVEKQRSFIRQALADHGIQRFENARPAPGAIIVTLPDVPEATSPAPPKANGAPTVIDIA